METLVQQVINGLALGSIYGLIAIGYTMVFGIIGMVNFAHGDLFMMSSFIAMILFTAITQALGAGSVAFAFVVVLVLGMAATSLWNWTIERVAYRPLRGSFRLAPLISAIGVSTVLWNFVEIVQGPSNKSIPPIISGETCIFGISDARRACWIEDHAGTIALPHTFALIMGVTAALLAAFWWLVQKTPLGRAQRACEQDRKMAALIGVDVDFTISMTFVIGAALASIAGLLFLVRYGVLNFYDGFNAGVKAFTAAVLGGVGSLPGAVLGGLLIGLIEILWSYYVSSDYKDVAAYSILAITLIFLPSGLLGRPEVEKV
ncbi:MAG: branched-chain amino acid ABC transporter permease LivH [Hyphomicrobiales bacterium]|nr:branched-chain amino acid ABC transporter permease LivH [Hyphomicrobiales bacterium]